MVRDLKVFMPQGSDRTSTGRKYLMSLPAPTVHYEIIRRSPGFPLDDFSEGVRTAMLLDPFNRTGKNPIPAQSMDQYSTTYQMMRCVFAYQRSGQQVVVLGPRMQEAFANTSLKEVSSRHIRFPYQCFYLAVPGCKHRVWGGSQTQWHHISGAYVMDDPSMDHALSILIWGAANDKSIDPLDDATFWLSLDLGFRGGDAIEMDIEGITLDVDARVNARLADNRLRDGSMRNIEYESELLRMDLDAQVMKVMADARNNVSDRYALGPDNDQIVENVKVEIRAFLRIVVNTLLYMSSASCETKQGNRDAERRDLQKSLDRKKHKKSKEARKIREKIEALPFHHITWIGPTIEDAKDADTDLTSHRTVRGHIRRGHWHTFLSGPRKDTSGDRIDPKARKATLRWVYPTWVGGGSTEDGPRLYGVKEPVQ